MNVVYLMVKSSATTCFADILRKLCLMLPLSVKDGGILKYFYLL